MSELRAAGVSHWRLYAGDVPRAFHGLAVAPGHDPAAFKTRVAGLRQLMTPGRFISRRTAAQLYGLPVDHPSEEYDIGAVRPTKPPQRKHIRGHQIRAGVFTQAPSAPTWLPKPEEVWALLAATDTLQQLVVVGDFLISGANRHALPLCALDDLQEVAKRFAGSAGISRLRGALPLLRTGVESPAESETRLLIVQAGIPEPQTCCRVPVHGTVLHADLGYPELKIAIEYEGEYHFLNGVEQARHDNSRHEAMRDAGWRVLTVTAIDLRDPRDFLRRLARAIEAARAARQL